MRFAGTTSEQIAASDSAAQPAEWSEWQLTYDVSVETEGTKKPALAVTWLMMQVNGGNPRNRPDLSRSANTDHSC
jgi:hypothetical protein